MNFNMNWFYLVCYCFSMLSNKRSFSNPAFQKAGSNKIKIQFKPQKMTIFWFTGKCFSETLLLVSTNPLYEKRLFIELQVQYMKIPSSEHVENTLCTQIVFCFDVQNNLCTQHVLTMFSPCSELAIFM